MTTFYVPTDATGPTYYLRGTIWTTEPAMGDQFPTDDAARVALARARKFNAKAAKAARVRSREGVFNCPERAGELAMRKALFGTNSRYAVAPVHTRGDGVQWFVWDAERIDPITGTPEVIRQEPTLADAVRGLRSLCR